MHCENLFSFYKIWHNYTSLNAQQDCKNSALQTKPAEAEGFIFIQFYIRKFKLYIINKKNCDAYCSIRNLKSSSMSNGSVVGGYLLYGLPALSNNI